MANKSFVTVILSEKEHSSPEKAGENFTGSVASGSGRSFTSVKMVKYHITSEAGVLHVNNI